MCSRWEEFFGRLRVVISFRAPGLTSPPSPYPLQQIAVPETLLKKRKSTDKTREEKLAKAAEAKKVRLPFTTNEQGSSRQRAEKGQAKDSNDAYRYPCAKTID